MDWRYVEEILPLARQHQVGTVCFKTSGAGKLLDDTCGYNQPLQEWPPDRDRAEKQVPGQPLLPHLSVENCRHYTLTCDPDVVLPGLSFPHEQDAAFAAAQTFTAPLAPEDMARIRQLAVSAIVYQGPCWWNP